MSTLFDATRHEALQASAWTDAAARAALQRIVKAAADAFDSATGWPAHPLDGGETADERFHMLYCGSGGVIWALEHLARAGHAERRHDFGPFVQGLVERNRAQMGPQPHGLQSFLLGDAGLQALQWMLSPSDTTAEDLHATVRSNLRNTALEQLWGSPGTLMAAIFMAEATGQPRWQALLREGVQILWDQMEPVEVLGGHWLWVQDLYGRREPMLGAGHGFAGNLFPALRGAALLDPAQAAAFAQRALQTLQATAVHGDDDLVNWPPDVRLTPVDRPIKMLVQDCHGAPGIVCRLATAPRSPEWDGLLQAAGELTWRAGPLSKGASICHGTAGSALALLKLWQRTGDALWLDRARAWAMHAVGQVEQHRQQHGMGRHSLWTGDLGLACVLAAAIDGRADFPTLDGF